MPPERPNGRGEGRRQAVGQRSAEQGAGLPRTRHGAAPAAQCRPGSQGGAPAELPRRICGSTGGVGAMVGAQGAPGGGAAREVHQSIEILFLGGVGYMDCVRNQD